MSFPGDQPPPHPTPYAGGDVPDPDRAPAQQPEAPRPPDNLWAPRPQAPGPTWAPPPGPPPRTSSGTPGWVWPVVAVTALVVGLLGGVLGGALVLGTSGGGAGGLGPLETGRSGTASKGSIAAVAQQLLPSTVQVRVRSGGKGKSVTGGTGSGFVIDRSGHVVTNNHVTEVADGGGTIIVVDNSGKPHDATLVGHSEVYDLAVVKIEDPGDLRPVTFGSSRSMYVGDTVVAIGSPLGLDHTVTAGIVSALDRPVTTGDQDSASYINAVQTDAAINPGNSGGPLVNLAGQVIGVNSAIATTGGGFLGSGESGSIGVGFAIPMEQVRITAQQILTTGKAQYPVIGANVDTGSSRNGAEVVEVPKGTPAAQAGLRKGDRIVAVEDTRVLDGISLIVAIRSHRPGEKLEMTVVRKGAERTLTIKLDAKVG
ncbi:S1C family serine protease [Nocardioides marmoribigeumensis]|uniref:Serine protease PepD n=1 Tax=Nocardioides marmoribigeumensis TaxID=433649 RepID=A0ABU2BXG5_9ACTN|nr:trypsin-like peptidase domain-containing protein [Nocardioides marmoribigeumensis]MDR7363088.1 putative serine protease PepD [Nocardioides marmoribigeumensis]